MTRTLTDLWEARFGLTTDAIPRGGVPLQQALPESVAGMLGRSTVRRYRAEPVPEALLSTLLACAQSAPS